MARTPSNMLPLGTKAPSFELLDTVSNKQMSLSNLKGVKGTVIMFICNHCPFVKHVNSALPVWQGNLNKREFHSSLFLVTT